MGGKLLDDMERKVDVKLKIKKKYLLELRKRDVNISKIFEEFVTNYLKKKQ